MLHVHPHTPDLIRMASWRHIAGDTRDTAISLSDALAACSPLLTAALLAALALGWDAGRPDRVVDWALARALGDGLLLGRPVRWWFAPELAVLAGVRATKLLCWTGAAYILLRPFDLVSYATLNFGTC
jgi:hypothetical protein